MQPYFYLESMLSDKSHTILVEYAPIRASHQRFVNHKIPTVSLILFFIQGRRSVREGHYRGRLQNVFSARKARDPNRYSRLRSDRVSDGLRPRAGPADTTPAATGSEPDREKI